MTIDTTATDTTATAPRGGTAAAADRATPLFTAKDAASLVDALARTAERVGDTRGVRFYVAPAESQFLGYAELDARARSIAAGLQAAGHRPGDAVVVAVLPGLRWADAAFGALYAGLVIVPVALTGFGTDDTTVDRIVGIAAASEAVAVIVSTETADRFTARSADLPPAHVLEELATTPADAWTKPPLTHDSPSALMFTSGSTGEPKGVISTHGTMLGMVETCAELYGFGDEAVVVGWVPLHHAMGLAVELVMPAVLGCQAVLTSPEQFQRRPVTWLQMLSTHRATFSVAGNFAFAVCTKLVTDAQIAELDLSALETLACGSEPIDPGTAAAFLERFRSTGLPETAFAPALGMSELSLVSSKLPGAPFRVTRVDPVALEQGALVAAADDAESVSLISLGVWPTSTSVKIVDPETHVVVPDGRIGELWLSSPYMSPGYFKRPEATAEAFGARIEGDDLGYYRSGDLGAILDGELYLTGRIKEVINVRGRNLYPQDLEAYARAAHSAVTIAAAFELADAPSAVGIIVELDAESEADADADARSADAEDVATSVRSTVVKRASLPSLAVAVVDAGSIPRTPTGKVRRRPAQEMLADGRLAVRFSRGFAESPSVRNDQDPAEAPERSTP